jgi:hypothetical protein
MAHPWHASTASRRRVESNEQGAFARLIFWPGHRCALQPMIHLPKLMLGDNLPLLVRITTALVDDYSPTVECNAEDLITAEPVALCLLAAAFGQLERRGQSARIRGLRPEVKENLERLDVLREWLPERPQQLRPAEHGDSQSTLRACRVATLGEANDLANLLSREIAAFVPADDLGAIVEADPSLHRYRVVEQPLGYVITELLDNSLSHASEHRPVDFHLGHS